MLNVLVTGGSGLIGNRLTERLIQRGHRVSHLGRTMHSSTVNSFVWDVDRHEIDPHAFDNIDAIVHLAGAGIADKRWTKNRKREILDSRVNSTRLLFDELKARNHVVKTFVAASAIGYYGFENREEVFTEDSAAGRDFLASVTERWEREIDVLNDLGLRVVKIRTGIVLSNDGGALKELLRPINLYAGAPLGSGNQYLSWIHIDDHCDIVIKALEDQTMKGPYNSVAPNPVTNRELTNAIAAAVRKPIFLPPVPAVLLKLWLGEMADLVLYGNRISAQKVINSPYKFRFAHVEDALHDLLGRKS